MKIGDYVRFYDRDWTEIGKIVGEVEDSHLKVVECKDGYYDLGNFIKSSPNIIDLIEVGDYVNGNKIIKISNDHCGRTILIYGFDDGDFQCALAIYQSDIKSIVTKECFESMEYRIGDE